MNIGSPDTGTEVPTSDHFHRLTVAAVAHETDDATTVTFVVPPALADRYAYRAGQFVTLRLVIGGEVVLRSYSMSTSPAVDEELAVTVKRVPGGLASTWINDELAAGDSIQVSVPAGRFVLVDDATGPIVAVAGGSGITPVFSILKTALATTDRDVHLLFANQHRGAAIFGDELDRLAAAHPDRLRVVHHEDCSSGFLGAEAIGAFLGDAADPIGSADIYVCGPAGLMALVETTLAEALVDPERIHVERFVPPPPDPTSVASTATATTGGTVTITAGGRTETVDQRDDFTLLHLARWVSLPAPSSCETGHCGSCMARLLEGEVAMRQNDALTDEEVADGLVLTCQALPLTDHVRVDYDL